MENDQFFDDGWFLLCTSAISFCITSFIIILYFVRKKGRSYGFTLVFGLCLSDWGLSGSIIAAVLTSNIDHSQLKGKTLRCNLFGASQNYFVVCSLLWTIAISKTLYDTLIRKQSLSKKNLFSSMMMYTFGFAGANVIMSDIINLIINLIFLFISRPLALDQYSPEQPFNDIECAINDQQFRGKIISFLNYIVYFWIALFYNIITIIKAKQYFAQTSSPSFYQTVILNMLYLYPMTLFVVYSPIMISRSFEMFGLKPPEIILKVAYYTLSLGGFANSTVYGYLSYFQNISNYKFNRANEKIESSIASGYYTDDRISRNSNSNKIYNSTQNSDQVLFSSAQSINSKLVGKNIGLNSSLEKNPSKEDGTYTSENCN